MKLKGILLTAVMSLWLAASPALAATGFVVKHIRFIGLKRIPVATAFNYMPLHVGSPYTASDGSAVIRALYDTGYFSKVELSRQARTLIVSVRERPVIGSVKVTGSKEISSKTLGPVLKQIGLQVGQVFRPSKLSEVVHGLSTQYKNIGFPSVDVVPHVKEMSGNRVGVTVHIKEGGEQILRAVHFDGNATFSSGKLSSQMSMTTSGILSFFSSHDRFSAFLLAEDLKKIKTFYLNQGYLKAKVAAPIVDRRKKGVYLTIRIHEGPRYKVSGYEVTGHTLQKESDLLKLVALHIGGYYSQADLVTSQMKISDFYASEGFAFPNIQIISRRNEVNHTVSLEFRILPGSRIYVNKITVEGNYSSKDVVVRRELRQLEGALYSSVAVTRSKQRLMLLGFFDKVDITHAQVPGHPDKMDLLVKVKERKTGSIGVQAGYDTSYGIVYGANFNEKNFLGSGNGVALGFQNNSVMQSYNLGFTQPYYLPSGVSRAFNLYYTRVSSAPKYNLDSSYRQDGYGLNINYSMPMSDRSNLSLGYGYEHIGIHGLNIDTSSAYVAVPSVLNYVGSGRTKADYDNLLLTAGWDYNNLDRAVFPTKGFSNGISAVISLPVMNSSVPYYIASYSAKWYQPLFANFILNIHGAVQYGDGYGRKKAFPFFKNFYLGGIGSLPGFESNSLGPWNQTAQTALGGNLSTVIGANLILPEFISPKVRTLFTLTAGNVFSVPRNSADMDSTTPAIVNVEKFSLSNMRVSAGFMLEWYMPMGVIDLSIATPLHKKKYDQEKIFDFSFGTSF